MRHAIASSGLMLLLVWQPACAMRFDFHPAAGAGGAPFVSASGPIRGGDDARLHAALQALPSGTRLSGISLDSPGGNLEEGMRLAASVHAAHLQTIVDQGAKCASACFLVFAAGSHRFASATALVGVHSASEAGQDTVVAQAATIATVRRLSEYGVPDVILGKLVTARPSQIWWLDRHELESMQVDMNVAEAAPAPVVMEIPPAVDPAAPEHVTPGFRVEPAATGFHLAAPAGGFRVWRPSRD